MNRIILAVLVGLLVAGCAGSRKPSDTSAAQGGTPVVEDPIGYYEMASGRSLYVLGSMKSADQFRAGSRPAKTIRRFDSKGREILFEADGLVLEKRLMAEYSRRHGPMN